MLRNCAHNIKKGRKSRDISDLKLSSEKSYLFGFHYLNSHSPVLFAALCGLVVSHRVQLSQTNSVNLVNVYTFFADQIADNILHSLFTEREVVLGGTDVISISFENHDVVRIPGEQLGCLIQDCLGIIRQVRPVETKKNILVYNGNKIVSGIEIWSRSEKNSLLRGRKKRGRDRICLRGRNINVQY